MTRRSSKKKSRTFRNDHHHSQVSHEVLVLRDITKLLEGNSNLDFIFKFYEGDFWPRFANQLQLYLDSDKLSKEKIKATPYDTLDLIIESLAHDVSVFPTRQLLVNNLKAALGNESQRSYAAFALAIYGEHIKYFPDSGIDVAINYLNRLTKQKSEKIIRYILEHANQNSLLNKVCSYLKKADTCETAINFLKYMPPEGLIYDTVSDAIIFAARNAGTYNLIADFMKEYVIPQRRKNKNLQFLIGRFNAIHPKLEKTTYASQASFQSSSVSHASL